MKLPKMPEPDPMSAEDIAELEEHEGAVCALGIALWRADGGTGDPHRLLYSGGALPEPECEAWQRHEDHARAIVEMVTPGTALALANAYAAGMEAAAEVCKRLARGYEANGDHCAEDRIAHYRLCETVADECADAIRAAKGTPPPDERG